MDQRVSSVRGYNPGPKQAREDLRGEGPGGTLQEGARAGGRGLQAAAVRAGSKLLSGWARSTGGRKRQGGTE